MANLQPNLQVQMGMNTAGVQKGAAIANKALQGVGQQAGQSQGKVDGFGKTLRAMWRITGGIVLFNIIRSVTRAFKDLIGVTLDFDTAMRNVNSVAHMDEAAFKDLQDQVVDLALDPRIKDGPAKLAEGLYTVTSAGYNAQDAMLIMEQAALASTAGMTTSAVAADVLISTLGAYNLTAKDAASVTNSLFEIVNISKYTFEQMASAMDTVTPTAAALGIGINEIGAAMAVFASHGVDANTATVQMNGILTAMLKPTDAMKAALGQLGYETGQQMLEANGFVNTMKIWGNVVGDDAGMAAALFGDVRALRGEMNLTNDGGVALTKNLELMNGAQEDGGAMARALAEQMKAVSFQIAIFKKDLQVLAVMGFGLISPYIVRFLNAINGLFAGVIKNFRTFRKEGLDFWTSLRYAVDKTITHMFGPELGNKFAKFVFHLENFYNQIKAIVETVAPPFMKFMGFLLDHLSTLVPAVLGAVIGVKLLTTALKVQAVVVKLLAIQFTPLLIAFIAIAAVVAILFVAYTKNWFGIRDKTKAAISAIVSFLDPFTSKFIKAFGTIKKGFELIGRGFKEGGLAGGLKALFGKGGQMILQGLGRILGLPYRIIGQFLRQIKTGFAPLDAILHNIGAIFQDVGLIIQAVFNGKWREAFRLGWDIMTRYVKNYKMIAQLLIDVFKAIPWGKIAVGILVGLERAGAYMESQGYPWMLDTMKRIWGALYDGILFVWNNDLGPFLGSFMGLVIGVFDTAIDWLYDVGKYLISGMWNGISDAFTWGLNWLGGAKDWIVGAFTGSVHWLEMVGHEIMNGLWNGMVSVINWMKQNFHHLVDWMPDFMKKQLGILSPSKVFAAIGKQIPAGLAMGMQSGMRDIENAMGRMNVSVMPTRARTPILAGITASGSAGSGRTSNQRILNIHPGAIVVKDSGNPKQTANIILRAIRNVEAGAA